MHLTLETCHFSDWQKFKKKWNFSKLRFTLEGLAPPTLSRFYFYVKRWNRTYMGTKLSILAQISPAVLSIITEIHFENYFLFPTLCPSPLSQTEISTFIFSDYPVLTFVQNIVTISLTVSQLRHVDRAFGRRRKNKIKNKIIWAKSYMTSFFETGHNKI